ncbi:MAG: DNA replication/repair protein RecF [Acidimicrobiales bacterium]
MHLDHLWLTDFRSWAATELEPAPGLTVVVGPNGAGKTNLLEAVGYLADLASFRGAPAEALVRAGCASAVVRGQGARGGRDLRLEAEIRPNGRGRVALNRQPVRRAADLSASLRVSVFSPDDLVLVKGPPAGRRRWLDDALVALHPRNDALRRDFERVVRQRTTLLGQAGGRLTPDVAVTLDVWDAKLVQTGEALAAARTSLVDRVEPLVAGAYAELAAASPRPGATIVAMAYDAPWREEGLAAALAAARGAELRRGVSLVGPHRDDVTLTVGGLAARTHASQGEQRSLALALRLGAHRVVADDLGEAPLLLLDDVFSELDAGRSQALLDHLPPGQALLTTTGAVPEGAAPERVVEVVDGTVRARDGAP